MFLQSIASALPPLSLTQREAWEVLRGAGVPDRLRPRSASLLETILLGDSGIERRHFALEDPRAIFSLDAEGLNRMFEREAPRLAGEALRRACSAAGLEPRTVDALFICTCTGYLCPGLSSHVSEQLGLLPSAFLQDLLGLGCGAALPMIETARGYLSANPDALVATVAVEICSSAFFVDDDPGVLISLCLFGDGAAAALWSAHDAGGQWGMNGFRSLHRPEHREKIRFVNSGGRLRNQLHRSVPGLAAAAVGQLFEQRTADPDRLVAHTGGRDVIDALEATLPGGPIAETRSVLRDCGNLSSPSVLFALERTLAGGHPELRRLWLTSFGAGFSAHACELHR